MSSRPLRFFHRGAVVDVADARPTRTVLDWLREEARCTGTKEGCNEGDCGACTVVVGRLASADDPAAVRGLALQAVNACIQLLPTLDGKALFSVEDLAAIRSAAPPDPPRPAAAGSGSPAATGASASRHAALVASATEASDPRSRTAPGAASAGTGAAPVGGAAGDSARVQPSHSRADGLHPVQRAMVECHGSQCGFCTPGFVMSLWSVYERSRARAERPSRQRLADDLSGNLCRCTGYRPILDAGERMFELPAVALDTGPVVAALQALREAAPLRLDGPAGRFEAPRTLDAFAAARLAAPAATVLAGSTDIGLWITKQLRDLPHLLFIGEVAELKAIIRTERELVIGAGASLEAAYAALAAEWPSLREVGLRFASVPIRNAGTMGGNVANGSPIGDSAPVLMALDAEVVLRRGGEVRRLPLAGFYTGYMTNALRPGEFVQAIAVPLRRDISLRVYKISKRFDCDISAVCAALAIDLDGDLVRSARFAYGGMAATVRRAAGAEAAVVGQPWSEATLQAAQRALAADFQPLTDMRASAGYRLQVAQNLLRRFWLETRLEQPLGPDAVSVWPQRPALAVAPAAPA